MTSSDMGSQSQQGGADQSSAVDQAKSEAGRLTQAARTRTMSYLEERKSLLAENVGGMASAARSAAEQFDEHGNRVVADYIQRAADGLERFSDAVRTRDISSLMGDAEDFARRQPAVFIGAGVAVGFMLARFLKSSSERREAERHGYKGGGYDYARGSAAESSFGGRAYQEGMTASPDSGWPQSGGSGGFSRGAGGSEGLARQEMGEGYTGSSRPGGPVSGGAAGGSSTSASSSTGSSPSSTGRKERRNAPDT
jgi:ElaB/YqjD/DUF883 family membrane-anchored ribosome-binding protein